MHESGLQAYKHRELHFGHILLEIRHEIARVERLEFAVSADEACRSIRRDVLTKLMIPVPFVLLTNSAE